MRSIGCGPRTGRCTRLCRAASAPGTTSPRPPPATEPASSVDVYRRADIAKTPGKRGVVVVQAQAAMTTGYATLVVGQPIVEVQRLPVGCEVLGVQHAGHVVAVAAHSLIGDTAGTRPHALV